MPKEGEFVGITLIVREKDQRGGARGVIASRGLEIFIKSGKQPTYQYRWGREKQGI